MEANKIPNIQIENIGTGKKPHHLIKGFIELPCWTGYFLTEEPNYSIKTKVVTDGRIDLWIDGGVRADKSFDIDREQINSYVYLVENQERIKHSILEKLKREFPRLIFEELSSWEEDNSDFPRLSDLTPEFDFKNYIGPASISIREDIKDNVAYINWHFRCLWDPEHGFEVITHKDRVIDIDPEADPWKIYQDNGTYEQELKEYNERSNVPRPPKQKRWWQFW